MEQRRQTARGWIKKWRDMRAAGGDLMGLHLPENTICVERDLCHC
jgi:hypothetical protein